MRSIPSKQIPPSTNYPEGLYFYKPSATTSNYEPSFLRLNDYLGFANSSSFWYSGQFALIEGQVSTNPWFPGGRETSHSPMVAISHLVSNARLCNIARPSYNRANFAGYIMNRLVNNDTTILYVKSFTILNDALFIEATSCTRNRVFEDRFGNFYLDTICDYLETRNNIFYISVSTIMDNLGIDRIVTQTKPKKQIVNSN